MTEGDTSLTSNLNTSTKETSLTERLA